ncbi:MAG: flippase [Anaerolineales bacterium]|nr:flippase [Anaerolineales bacterium]
MRDYREPSGNNEMPESLLSRFIKGTISVGFGNVALMMFGLMSTVIVARYVPKEDYGQYVLIIVIASLLARVSSFGLNMALVNYIINYPDELLRRQITNTAIWFRVLTIFATSALAIFVKPVLVLLFGSFISSHLIFIACVFLVNGLADIFKAVLQGLFRFKHLGMANIISSALNFCLILVTVVGFNQGLVGLVFAIVVSQAVACAFMVYSIPVKKRIELNRDILRSLLHFGFPLLINDILSFFFSRIDTLVIGILLTPADIANYEIARRIPDTLRSMFEAFGSVYFPFISTLFKDKDSARATELLNNSTRLIGAASILGALLVVLFRDQLVRLLFSAEYLASAPVFALLMVTISVAFVSNIMGTSIVAAGDTNKPAMINALHSTVTLIGNLVFIWPLGIFGAALANLVGTVVANPVNLFFIRRHGISAKIEAYLKPFLIFGVHVFLFEVFDLTSFLQKLALILTFIASNLFMSVITRQELLVLKQEMWLVTQSFVRRLIPRNSKS